MILPQSSIVQLAWVVPNLEEAASRFARIYDAGPFIMNRHIKVDAPKYRGADVTLDFSTAIAQAGPVQIELVEQHNDGPSAYRDLVGKGKEGFHHAATLVPDVRAEVARLTKQGFAVAFEGTFGGSYFVYVDTSPVIGHMIEVLPDDAVINGFFGMIRKAAERWDRVNLLQEARAK